MNRLIAVRGAPKRIRVDNGPEFVSRALDQWAYLQQVTLDFSRLGKPTDNALVESLNRRLRALNTNWFFSLDDARRKIEAWRQHYNESRPNTSLGFVPPSVFAQRAAENGVPSTRITHSRTGLRIGGPSFAEPTTSCAGRSTTSITMSTSTLSSNLQSINYNHTVESDGVSDRRHRHAHLAVVAFAPGSIPPIG
jgi:hypothetical protein